jgi:ADP-ribose pyrophosphatase YjhB (NUDIX family)
MAACNNTNENFRQHQDASARFRHALDSSRLGRRHDTLESYTASVGCGSKNKDDHPKDFSLVTILCRKKGVKTNNTSSLSILIGRKRRGFGAGLYNCFGGKLEKDLGEQKHPAKGAVREVLEETGVSIPLSTMEESKVGTINFTFDDWQDHSAMRVHLFCVFVSLSEDATCSTPNQTQNASTVTIHPDQIRGCDEIEPCWVHDCYDLPLHQMFADDSIWLPMLLHHHEASIGESNMRFDAWFHFHKGGAETNSIMHYYISIQNETASEQSAAKYNLEKKLFHALHDNHIHNPSIKEFKESWSFANSVRSFLKEEKRMKYVLDVAGGHGALGKLGYLDVLSM